MAKKAKRKGNKVFSIFITIGCLAIIGYASHGLIDAGIDYYKNRKMMSSLQDIYYEPAKDETTSAIVDERKIRSGFENLLAHNEDVVGWINIADTQIDYPIVASVDNNDYLQHNFYGDFSRAGSIFMDFRNDVDDQSDNTVIYGHRVKDGSMFQHITKFLDKDFFDSHQTFEYETLYDSYEAEVFAVYNTLTDFNYIETEFANEDEWRLFQMQLMTKAQHSRHVDLNEDDKIITLSTCDYELDPNKSRLVVHAKLTKKDS